MPGLMTLSATWRRTGCSCSARKTTPIPPSPISRRSTYGPTARARPLEARTGRSPLIPAPGPFGRVLGLRPRALRRRVEQVARLLVGAAGAPRPGGGAPRLGRRRPPGNRPARPARPSPARPRRWSPRSIRSRSVPTRASTSNPPPLYRTDRDVPTAPTSRLPTRPARARRRHPRPDGQTDAARPGELTLTRGTPPRPASAGDGGGVARDAHRDTGGGSPRVPVRA